jgi:hypothetical protein
MMSRPTLAVVLGIVLTASVSAWSQQITDQTEAGAILYEQGVDGLKELLARVGGPPLTFDQEAQIRNLHDVYQREGRRILEEQEGDAGTLNRTLADQLFLAAAKLLNPVQRDALGAVADAAANSDLPSDPNELREYLRDLTSPASDGGGGDGDRDDDDGPSSMVFRGAGCRIVTKSWRSGLMTTPSQLNKASRDGEGLRFEPEEAPDSSMEMPHSSSRMSR